MIFFVYSCQFVVNSCGDYKQYVNNPDALVNWDFIEQVVSSAIGSYDLVSKILSTRCSTSRGLV